MRTLVRALVWLLVVLWLGGVMFFPVVAWAAFSSIPDTHAAGTIVAKCLRTLHYEGLFSGVLIVLLLLAGWRMAAFSRVALGAIVLVFAMLALTGYSQFSIIPRMEGYRMAAGGAIDSVPKDNPNHVAFDQLHQLSERVEEGVLLSGVLTVIFLALPGQARRIQLT
jgi:hypothetical protein